jgi:hypothetical protein
MQCPNLSINFVLPRSKPLPGHFVFKHLCHTFCIHSKTPYSMATQQGLQNHYHIHTVYLMVQLVHNQNNNKYFILLATPSQISFIYNFEASRSTN